MCRIYKSKYGFSNFGAVPLWNLNPCFQLFFMLKYLSKEADTDWLLTVLLVTQKTGTIQLDVPHLQWTCHASRVAGHLDRMMKSVLSLTNMCECELVTSVSMFDVSCTPCIACQQYKYCMSRAFCHSRGEVGQHLLFLIQPKRLSSAVTHRYTFRKGMALILHWVVLEKT